LRKVSVVAKKAAKKKKRPTRKGGRTETRKSPKTSTPRKKVAKKVTKKTTKKTTRKPVTKKATAKKATKAKASAIKGKSVSKSRTARQPVTNPLKPAEIEQFRQLLLEKRAELVGDVSLIESEALKKSRLDAAGDLSSMPIHMADIGTDNFEQEFALGLMSSERKILLEIEAALQRIRDGRYGICEGTGKPIGKKRLEAIPWARYSMEYAQMVEKGLVEEGERVGGYEGWEEGTGAEDVESDLELEDEGEGDEEVDPFEYLNDDEEDEDY
jgi:DnaK suppressor protein